MYDRQGGQGFKILFYKSPCIRSTIATPCIVSYYEHSEWFAYYL